MPPHLKVSRIPILSYGAALYDQGESDLRAKRFERLFRRQLEFLERWDFTPITFRDYELCSHGQLTLPRRPVILCFDGGNRPVFNSVYPLLCEFGVKAVIFVVADETLTRGSLAKSEVPIPPKILDQLTIVEMHSMGFEIGSHGHSYSDLTVLPEQAAKEAIARSKVILEILLNAQVRAFAYPYGKFNGHLKSFVQQAGFLVAVCESGKSSLNAGDDFEIRGFSVPPSMSLRWFARRLLIPLYCVGS